MLEQDDELFCIDTSALIHAWNRDYPPDVFGTIWENLEILIAAGSLISPEEVLLELERGGDEIYDWAKSQASMFVKPGSSVQAKVRHIVNAYRSFLPDHSRDGIWADPYIIALAIEEHAIVVTGEKPVGLNARAPKIPNICNDLGVDCTDMLGLIRICGWQF
ncbi:MAG: DUF4411 family protein [Chloroflexota bacterium]|nr:DUF4411 family protein [Chloroflexota bacterium]